MANSFVRYTGNGSTTAYAVPFSYRLTTDVTVTINGVTKTVTSDYTYNSAGTQITFTSAPASNAAIEIRRTTSQTSRLTDYASGSVLTEDDLDTDSTQGFFMSQEAIDDAGDKISLDNADFQWSAGSKRIKNITDPTGAQDAATKNYLENTWLTPANKTALTTVNANIANINAVNSNASNVNTVSANNANVTTVANNIGSVNTVASDITKVVAVANDLAEAVSEIETVADDLNETTSEIDTVSNNIANVNTVGGISSDVTTVAGISANVTTVAGNNANVTAVAGNNSNITAVATNATNINAVNANSSNINTVAGNNSNVSTVAGIDSDVTGVAGISSAVTAVNSNSSNINTVSGNNSNVSTVAGISGNVTTVAGIASDVTAVAGDATDIGAVAAKATQIGLLGTTDAVADMNTLGTADVVNDMNVLGTATNVTNMDTIAGISGNVTTAAGISGNITTVAGISSDVTGVAGIASTVSAVNSNSSNINAVNSNSSNINTVAANDSNITTVANADSNITAVAGNASNINTVGAAIANVNNVGGSIANVNTVAGNLASVNAFGETYRIGTSDPTTSLNEGDLFYNSTSNSLKVYDGSAWVAGVTLGSGFLPLTGGGLTGALTTSSTIDGRDVATDGTKLDGIEASATADQTGAEIKSAYESESNTNAFTDALQTKLNGIETSATADQTKSDIDALNINADTLDGQHGSYYTGYTDTAVSNLVDSSPAALNTLNELASALGDDANFSTTVNNNIATKLPLAGGTMTGDLKLNDNVKAKFGTGDDLQIYHNGSDSYIDDNGSGDFDIRSNGTKISLKRISDGHEGLKYTLGGSVLLKYDNNNRLETSNAGVDVTGGITVTGTVDGVDIASRDAVLTSTTTTANNALPKAGGTMTGDLDVQATITSDQLIMGDNQKIKLGNSGDLEIFHNGSSSIISDTGTGGLVIQASGTLDAQDTSGEKYFLATSGGSIDLYYDNSKKFETTSAGVSITGDTALSGQLSLADSQKIKLGNSDDLEIYHDGSHSYISDVGTGNLYLKGNGGVSLRGANDEQLLSANQDGAVEIYYNNSNKFNTTNTGVSITGTTTSSGNTISDGFVHKVGGTQIGNISSSGDDLVISASVSNGAMQFRGNDGGSTITALTLDIQNAGAATFNNNVTAFSDERLKTNIKTIDNALDKVSQMRGVTFERDGVVNSGVIAQEFEKIAPELVKTADDEIGTKSVAYGNTVGYLIEAIKELKAEVAELKCKKECECK